MGAAILDLRHDALSAKVRNKMEWPGVFLTTNLGIKSIIIDTNDKHST